MIPSRAETSLAMSASSWLPALISPASCWAVGREYAEMNEAPSIPVVRACSSVPLKTGLSGLVVEVGTRTETGAGAVAGRRDFTSHQFTPNMATMRTIAPAIVRWIVRRELGSGRPSSSSSASSAARAPASA